ncbi:MAG: DUF4932 domain-containing protein [Anaerolineaceae bacterium]|nr:DUF4932 domain-containing protein [Anaerolineaceae bacterium]
MPLQVRFDERIRLTASALLLTRFQHEQNQFKWHSLKNIVLAHIEPFQHHPFIDLLSQLSEKWWMHRFYSIAVLLEPREGAFRASEELTRQIPELGIVPYNELLWQFSQESRIQDLWLSTSHLWEQVIADCSTLLVDGKVEEFLTDVYGPTVRNLIVVPNPLDPAAFGFGALNAESMFSIIGPPAIPVTDSREPGYLEWGSDLANLVVHEFSHPLLTSTKGHANLVEATKHLAEHITARGYFVRMYDSWEGQIDEIIIRAIEVLYLLETQGDAAAETKLEKEMSEYGIHLIRPIFDLLRSYLEERHRGKYAGLADFIPDFLLQIAAW